MYNDKHNLKYNDTEHIIFNFQNIFCGQIFIFTKCYYILRILLRQWRYNTGVKYGEIILPPKPYRKILLSHGLSKCVFAVNNFNKTIKTIQTITKYYSIIIWVFQTYYFQPKNLTNHEDTKL